MKPKQFYYLLTGIIVLALAAGGATYGWANTKLRHEIQTLKIRLADVQLADTSLDELAKLQNKYQAVSSAVPKLYEALPKTKQQSAIVNQLQQIAAASGVDLVSTSFLSGSGLPGSTSQTQVVGGLLSLPANVQINGSYTGLLTFLQRLETLNRFNSVTAMNVTKGVSASSPLTINLTINAYLKK